MSKVAKKSYKKRNFEAEARQQVTLISRKEQSEEFLMNVSTNDERDYLPPTNESDRDAAKMHLSVKAKNTLEAWMYNHRNYCYPTKLEKQMLAIETGLSVQKVSNWFINSRRRMLPKMLEKEGKNVADFTISRKKKKASVATAPPGASIDFNMWSTDVAVDDVSMEEIPIVDENHILLEDSMGFDEVNQAVQLRAMSPLDPIIEMPTSTTLELTNGSGDLNSNQLVTIEENRESEVIRGILYDERTDAKCFFIIIN